MELQGQVAIVTGSGRGIGRATGLELGRMGAHIVVAELDPANAERTAAEVRALDRRALVVPFARPSRLDWSVHYHCPPKIHVEWIDVFGCTDRKADRHPMTPVKTIGKPAAPCDSGAVRSPRVEVGHD